MSEHPFGYYRCPKCHWTAPLEEFDVLGAKADYIICPMCGEEFCEGNVPEGEPIEVQRELF